MVPFTEMRTLEKDWFGMEYYDSVLDMLNLNDFKTLKG